MGIEGDPCSVYRGDNGAPSGTITSVTRGDDGFVKFNVRLDTSGDEIELDNRNISPERVWEVHPEFVDAFRGRIQHDDESVVSDTKDESQSVKEETNDDEFRSSVENRVESLGERLKRMETAESELERTIASAVRELAGDLMRAYRGEEPEFAFRYADRYDLALTRSSENDDADEVISEFRGAVKRSKHSNPIRQSEKDTFDIESLAVRESSVLSN
jgi:hypothetical protein